MCFGLSIHVVKILGLLVVKLCGLTGLSEVQYRRLQGVSPL